MPTPSSNPPPDPSLPTFSSCPEDTPRPPRPNAQPGHLDPVDMELHRSNANTEVSQVSSINRTTRMLSPLEVETSVEPSSRATTMSPRPQSSATGITSPGDLDSEPTKCIEPEQNDHGPRSTSVRPRIHAGQLSTAQSTLDTTYSEDDYCVSSMGSDYPSLRTLPISPSSYLRPGSRFHGSQQSERQVYDVQVEIKHVDMRESFLCGYLRIQGLTEDHPTLTTYFEGEIIGTKYSFFTQHEDWGANMKVDLSHWAKFNAFRPFQKLARRGPVIINDVAQRENIFMRWKEHFLVPDHRVRTITGASFEGFYYICFNQLKGEVSGIYFHSKSEKFQQLELKHVPDRGCFSAVEFR